MERVLGPGHDRLKDHMRMLLIPIQPVLHLHTLLVDPLELSLEPGEQLLHLRRQMDVVLRLNITFARQFNANFLD